MLNQAEVQWQRPAERLSCHQASRGPLQAHHFWLRAGPARSWVQTTHLHLVLGTEGNANVSLLISTRGLLGSEAPSRHSRERSAQHREASSRAWPGWRGKTTKELKYSSVQSRAHSKCHPHVSGVKIHLPRAAQGCGL